MTTRVTLFFDPVCPFAWVSSQWLREVEERGLIELDFQVMSLGVLNAPLDDPFEEGRGLDSAWRPVRAAVALASERGDQVLRRYFQEFGQRFHVERVRGRDRVIRETLAALGADYLYQAADDHRWDEAVRKSHNTAIADLGPDVGTPILHIDGQPVFGPVLSAVPRAGEAVEVFGATVTLMERPEFFEMKRPPLREIEVS